MTNGDVIRRKLFEMSDDELSVCVADFVMDNINSSEWYALDGKFPRERVLTWLGMESKEEDPDSSNNEMSEVRLIDANALLNSMCCLEGETQCDAEDCIRYNERKYIEAAPTIEAEQVRHGRWIFVGEETMHDGWTYRKHKCSECGFSTVEAKNFCQNCGAKMCGDTENG